MQLRRQRSAIVSVIAFVGIYRGVPDEFRIHVLSGFDENIDGTDCPQARRIPAFTAQDQFNHLAANAKCRIVSGASTRDRTIEVRPHFGAQLRQDGGKYGLSAPLFKFFDGSIVASQTNGNERRSYDFVKYIGETKVPQEQVVGHLPNRLLISRQHIACEERHHFGK